MAKTETTAVLLRLAPELLAAIDEMRGETPRSIFIRNRLSEIVAKKDPRLAAAALAMAYVRDHNPLLGARPKSTLVPEADSDTPVVQFGPIKRKPGEGLKKPKGGK